MAKDSGAVTFVLSENLGHGYALRVGYALCIELGAAVRRHARRRRPERPGRDPGHAPAPGRRRGGLRRGLPGARAATPPRDRFRKAGVRVFSWIMSAMGHTKLTDTSNGYRALRVSMLDDVAHRLVQPQYQTAELLIIAMKRGWRVTERPTRVAAAGVGHDQEGQELALRLPLRPGRARDVVEGPEARPGTTEPAAPGRAQVAPRKDDNGDKTTSRTSRLRGSHEEAIPPWHPDDTGGQHHPSPVRPRPARRGRPPEGPPAGGRVRPAGAPTCCCPARPTTGPCSPSPPPRPSNRPGDWAGGRRRARARPVSVAAGLRLRLVVDGLERGHQRLGGGVHGRAGHAPTLGPRRRLGWRGRSPPESCAAWGRCCPWAWPGPSRRCRSARSGAPVRADRKAAPSMRSSITGPVPARPLGEQHEDLALAQHLLGPLERLAVGRLPVDREGADAEQQLAEPLVASTSRPWS